MSPRIDAFGEPETEYFTVMAVADLPTPEPWQVDCMGEHFKGIAPGKPCCWYHAQDWTMVSERAIELLAEAEAAGNLFASDVNDFVRPRLGEEARLRRGPLLSLFSLADAIQVGHHSTGYRNGQHRAQAMKDLGVERTVVLRWPRPEN